MAMLDSGVEAHFLRMGSSSMTLGTTMARIWLGDRDKSVEDVLGSSIMIYSAKDSVSRS
jgi:hypothetical protein